MEARKMTLEELNAAIIQQERKRISELKSKVAEQAEEIAELVQRRKDDRDLISAMSARMAAKDAEIKFYQEIISEKFKQEQKSNVQK